MIGLLVRCTLNLRALHRPSAGQHRPAAEELEDSDLVSDTWAPGRREEGGWEGVGEGFEGCVSDGAPGRWLRDKLRHDGTLRDQIVLPTERTYTLPSSRSSRLASGVPPPPGP